MAAQYSRHIDTVGVVVLGWGGLTRRAVLATHAVGVVPQHLTGGPVIRGTFA